MTVASHIVADQEAENRSEPQVCVTFMPLLSGPISPARTHVYKLPKQCHPQGPRVQIYESVGVISGLNHNTSHGSLHVIQPPRAFCYSPTK